MSSGYVVLCVSTVSVIRATWGGGGPFLSRASRQRGEGGGVTHQQALSALLFLYKEVLGVNLPWLTELDRPKKPEAPAGGTRARRG